jgi:hypothetical protein
MQASKETILAIIPAYCEGRFIGMVVRQVLQYVQAVLVVDDGSSDNTATEAEAAGAKVIRHTTNLGKGAALKTGLEYALTICSSMGTVSTTRRRSPHLSKQSTVRTPTWWLGTGCATLSRCRSFAGGQISSCPGRSGESVKSRSPIANAGSGLRVKICFLS